VPLHAVSTSEENPGGGGEKTSSNGLGSREGKTKNRDRRRGFVLECAEEESIRNTI